MLNKFKKQMKNEKGLTLIELLAVIVILAIVAAIAIPAIGGIIENSRVKGAKADVANIISAGNIYFTDTGLSTFSDDTDVKAEYLTNQGSVKTFTVTKADTGVVTVIATGTTGGKNYTIASGTLDQLEVDQKNTDSDTFSYD